MRGTSLCSFSSPVDARRIDCGFGFLLPFIGHGVLLSQSIERIQELSAPAVVINLVHILR